MQNFSFIEFEILEYEHDPVTRLIKTAVARLHSSLNPVTLDLTFSREELISHFRWDEKVYTLSNNEKTYLNLVIVDGMKYIRMDQQSIPEDNLP